MERSRRVYYNSDYYSSFQDEYDEEEEEAIATDDRRDSTDYERENHSDEMRQSGRQNEWTLRDQRDGSSSTYPESSRNRDRDRVNYQPLEAPLYDLYDTEWNSRRLLRDNLSCTTNLGRGCEPTAPLSEILRVVFPNIDPDKWNAFHLQSSSAARHFRHETEGMLEQLALGHYEREPFRPGSRMDATTDIRYIIHPYERHGVYPVLFEVITAEKKNLCAQAVDPLLHLDGAEHLRVVKLNCAVAKEVNSGLHGFDSSRTAPGDLIWVYRLALSKVFAETAIQNGLDLRHFPSRNYLEGVKSGNCPKTVFQVAEFALVTPHAPIISRLARASLRYLTKKEQQEDEKMPYLVSQRRTLSVVIEGETRTARLDRATLLSYKGIREFALLDIENQPRRQQRAVVFRVFFRPPRSSMPHFSAPPRDSGVVRQIISETLRRDRDFISLIPDRIGITGSENASRTTQSIVAWKFHDMSSGVDIYLGEDGWREALEIVELGETCLRFENMQRLDRALYKLTMEITKRGRTVAMGFIVLRLKKDDEGHNNKELADKTNDTDEKILRRNLIKGWSERGRRVGIRRTDQDDWICGSIVKGEIVKTKLTVWISFDAAELRDEEWSLKVQIKLDRSVPSKLNDLMLGKAINIPRESNGERVLRSVYQRLLDGTDEASVLPSISSSLSLPATFRREFLWTEEQREVIARGPSLNLHILNVDAGAGTGKTTAIVGAIEQTLAIHGDGTLIIATAVTNVAVETLVEKMLSIGSERMKVTRLPGRVGAPADLLQQLVQCADDDNISARLHEAARKLRRDTYELRELQMMQADETLMDPDSLDRNRFLHREIEKRRDDATGDFLYYRRPNVLALTLDTLIITMNNEGPVSDYINRAERLFLWMDEASQAPELTLAAVSQLLPRALQRYVGDRRQLAPQHHHHYNDDATDAKLAGSVSQMLSQSGHTPTLRMRQCHRMHPALLSVASSLFYDESLVAAVTAEERALDESILIPDRSFPLCVITTEGGHSKSDVGFSIYNDSQEHVAINLVQNLLEPAYGKDVAILSCYRESVMKIRKAAPDIKVTTVDSSMGTEYDVVVVLTTRSEDHGPEDAPVFTFIDDARRVNVALTRARRAVFVIGTEEVWASTHNWGRVHRKAAERGNALSLEEAMEALEVPL